MARNRVTRQLARTCREIPMAAQHARRAALASAARHRPLLPDERREADSLDHRAYMRTWRSNNRAMLR